MTEIKAIGRFSVRQDTLLSRSVDLSKYDLVVAAVSWESRCTFAIKALGSKVQKLNVLRFETTDQENDHRKNNFLSELSLASNELETWQLGRSIAYASNVRLLDEFLAQAVSKAGRPLRLLFDMTCFPKSYILFLLGMGFKKGYLAKLDCLYSEGSYSAVEASTLRGTSDHGPISEGKWDSMSVPYFEAEVPIPKSRDVLVTIGGEVGLTVPFIEKYEPSRLQILGIERSFGEQEQLNELLREPNVAQSKFDVCNAMGVATFASDFSKSSLEDVVTALAVGSKPHALGLGIAALANSKMEIVCRVPKRFTMMDIPASGRISLYEIEDRFEPHAYL
jgi:hypothetical protein